MRIVVFDTETTGLPTIKLPAKDKQNNWPHIVSISWMVLENLTPLYSKSFIVKPNQWTISPESTKIHGITQDMAMEKGVSLKHAMDEFISEKYDLLLAHNLDFDEQVVVQAIYWDLGRTQFTQLPQPKRCSMRASVGICRIEVPYANYYKNPKLSELYEYCMGNSPDASKLHGSMYDVEVLVQCVQNSPELRERLGLRLPPAVEYNAPLPNGPTLRI